MIDWLIVGGGIHGVHLALVLLHRGVPPERLAIVDPQPRLLGEWHRLTANVGMRYLRSPVVHHVGVQAAALWSFAQTEPGRPHARFLPPYQQPSSELFSTHAIAAIDRSGLSGRHVCARVLAVELGTDPAGVETTVGRMEARRVVLALGGMLRPAWPEWAHALKAAGGDVCHVFEPGIQLAALTPAPRELIVGGGLSAAQLALKRAGPGRQIRVIARHPLRVHQFDADPGWLGPKELEGFAEERHPGRRREAIDRARYRGSMPKETARALREAEPSRLSYHQDEILGAEASTDGIRAQLSSGASLAADRVILATGFDARRLGERTRSGLRLPAALPLSRCGFPLIDEALRWHPRLHVTGALAELELGPTSRNIAGARNAALRIAGTLRSSTEAGRST